MEYAVSSWFVEQAASENPPVKRVFTIGDSDYTDFVLRWPSITRQWNELKPTNVTISLANEAQTFNFFRDVKTKIQDTCRVKIGFHNPNLIRNSHQIDMDLWTNRARISTAVYSSDGTSLIYKTDAVSLSYFGHSVLASSNETAAGKTFTFAVDLKASDTSSGKPGIVALYGYNSTGSLDFAASAIFTLDPTTFFRKSVTNVFTLGMDVRTIVVRFDERSLSGNIWSGSESFYIRNPQLEVGAVANSYQAHVGTWFFDELIAPFTGKVTGVEYSDGACSLRITDKVQGLSDRIVGTSNSAAIFSSSNLLASDIAWTLCTCYGQLSAVASASNPDIDYASWLAWAAVFSSDTVTMGARFTGQKVTECLRKLAEHTQSAVFLSDDRLTFFRWTTANTRLVTLDSRHIKGVNADLKADGIVNKQWVEFLYNPSSENWSASVFAADTPSVNSYGTREYVEKDESVWYVSSASALNLAQRRLYTGAQPVDGAEIKTVLVPLHLQVGDTIAVVDPLLELSAGWRIMKHTLNLEDGSMNLSIDASQVATPFILDYSALDGADLLQ